MTDFTIAIIIFSVFFLFICGIFVDGYIREWIAEERVRGCKYAKTERT